MSVQYKFKGALDFDTITFDGLHISVGDLKKAITQQKRLDKSTDFDLQITNAQTREEYADDSTLIPKNTSLIIARIPSTIHHKKIWDPQTEKNQGIQVVNEPNSGILDLSQMNGTEEDKIQAMMIQSTIDYDPKNYHEPEGGIRSCTAVSSIEQAEIIRNICIPRSFIENFQDQQDPPQTDETNQKQDDGAQENTEDKNLYEDNTTESVTEQDAEMETEESDYEDNIIVIMPPAYLQLQAAVFGERYNERHL